MSKRRAVRLQIPENKCVVLSRNYDERELTKFETEMLKKRDSKVKGQAKGRRPSKSLTWVYTLG